MVGGMRLSFAGGVTHRSVRNRTTARPSCHRQAKLNLTFGETMVSCGVLLHCDTFQTKSDGRVCQPGRFEKSDCDKNVTKMVQNDSIGWKILEELERLFSPVTQGFLQISKRELRFSKTALIES
jgi:hypothetical protein